MKVAVIGTGIAGMACASRLHPQIDIELYESETEPGGHTHTVDIIEDGKKVPIDTGFMVYNEVTYPKLIDLLSRLKVPTMPTDMSFGLQHIDSGLEFCGSGLNSLFAQRRNLFSPSFWKMLRGIMRFNKAASAALQGDQLGGVSLREFVGQHDFGADFLRCYLLPMTSAIWSTPPDGMLNFPAASLFRFLHNHGLLGVTTHHQWRTVVGGSRVYRDKLIAPFLDRIRCACPVKSVRRLGSGKVSIEAADGTSKLYDRVVMATHADTALSLLANPSPAEASLLQCFRYTRNAITLHTDASVMPREKRAWASWNYRLEGAAEGGFKASTHYWMNSLQKLPTKRDYFVSVDGRDLVDPPKILQSFSFDHPVFDGPAVAAQANLPRLNRAGPIFFCGSYFRYGFHEDALMAGFDAADALFKTTPGAK